MNQRLFVITYRATLDVSRALAQYVAALLLAERRQRGTRAGVRKLSCFCRGGFALVSRPHVAGPVGL